MANDNETTEKPISSYVVTGTSITFGEVKTGQKVKLTERDNTSNAIIGVVQAIANYNVAKAMQTDIASKHAAMQATANGTLTDIIYDTFLILDIGGIRPIVVAKSWIVDGTLQLIEKGSTYRIKLIGTKEQAEQAIAILRASNIVCSLEV